MRNLVAAIAVLGLLAVPSLGTVYVQVVNSTGGSTISLGSPNPTSATVEVRVYGDLGLDGECGVLDLAGSVVGTLVTGTPTLTASAFNWDAAVNDLSGSLIPAVAPSAASLGGMTDFAKAQFANDGTMGPSTYVRYAYYTITASGSGTVSLNFVNSTTGITAGTSGMTHITTDGLGGETVVVGSPLVVTVVGGGHTYTVGSSTVDNTVAGKKTNWRNKKSLFRLTFTGTIPAAPTSANIMIQELLAGGAYGANLASNFTFTWEAGGVLKVYDNSGGGTTSAFTHRKWYCIRATTASWSGLTADFKVLIPNLIGDVDGNGVITSAGDVSPIVAKLPSPSFGATNDADRRDIDGNKVCTSAGDVSPTVADLVVPNNTLLPKPSGH